METMLLTMTLLPLLGSLFHVILGRAVSRRIVEAVACACICASFLLSVAALCAAGQNGFMVSFGNWFAAGDFIVNMNVYYDPLSAVMCLVVTFISSLVHLYSVSFMRNDEDYVRYFCYLNLFVFAMLIITLADNLVFLYLGWEGVGFCSYALIGFWYRDVTNAAAGRKAFLLTRIGDVAFVAAIGLFFITVSTVSIAHINAEASTLAPGLATVFGLLLLWAAVGKSAQLPLAVWLPDAMAGPTPVSALIHAATMVTAGVYLLMRLFSVISRSPVALLTIGSIGAVTALYAASSALTQKDIKRILAYSTISQVGYMFIGVGAGDICGSMFHLISHAFFKSLLFLGAGYIIQALDDEHDIFRMGNLRERLPSVFLPFLCGSLALGAIPPLSGFFSKDRILLAAFVNPEPAYKIIWIMAVAGALLTSLYTFRLFFIIFLKKPVGPLGSAVSRPPNGMLRVIWPLAVLSVIGGMLNLPVFLFSQQWLSRYLSTVPGSIAGLNASPALESSMAAGSGLLTILFLILAYILYRPGARLGMTTPVALKQSLQGFFASGFYLDRLYQQAITRPYRSTAKILWVTVDEIVIDHSIMRLKDLFLYFSARLRLWTTGSVSSYIGMLLLGVAAMLTLVAAGWLVRP
jgi:NADH-quinone oxidoreductase subunit L